jgi:hypothetical protein
MAGVYTDQRLNLSKLGRPAEESQGFKPDPRNLAVRDYSGASGKEQPTRPQSSGVQVPVTANCLSSGG